MVLVRGSDGNAALAQSTSYTLHSKCAELPEPLT